MNATETEPDATQRPNGAGDSATSCRQVFRREGEYWTIEYAGTVCRLRDGSGLRYLACLLCRPGEMVPSTELIGQHGRGAPSDHTTASTKRPTITECERARVSVTRAIRAALQRLGEHHPALVEHFQATIRTGTSCSYAPDARRAKAWEL